MSQRTSKPIVHRWNILQSHHSVGIFFGTPQPDASSPRPPLMGQPQTRRGNQQSKEDKFENGKGAGSIVLIGLAFVGRSSVQEDWSLCGFGCDKGGCWDSSTVGGGWIRLATGGRNVLGRKIEFHVPIFVSGYGKQWNFAVLPVLRSIQFRHDGMGVSHGEGQKDDGIVFFQFFLLFFPRRVKNIGNFIGPWILILQMRCFLQPYRLYRRCRSCCIKHGRGVSLLLDWVDVYDCL